MPVEVKERDSNYKKIVENLKRLNKKSVKAGVFSDAGKEDNGTPIVDVAIYNEYGTRFIPSRPFVRIATEKNKKMWLDGAEQVVDNVIDGQKANFSNLGKQMVENIREVIGDKGLLVPNAPSTIRRKGHDLPLIETGKLKKSIRFEVG